MSDTRSIRGAWTGDRMNSTLIDSPSSNALPPGAIAPRPRRFWQATVVLGALMFVLWVVLIAATGVWPGAMDTVLAVIDAAALVALAGYAWRWPLRGFGLQLLVLALAALAFLRVAIIAIVLWPNLVPWLGDVYAWQALATYCVLPLLLLIAVGLYRYAWSALRDTPERHDPSR